ncbi:MAG: cob(I)yrinic acid a,c-diamide adenosyltransferase [Dysgonamonadaceae bacterium]|jgi:cob(I)alamin adenosyltransferase|nr:cob(I)yrinic acid a,c-diamide adenosyltransferase [Dysgonamonadaceae bacterium]
MEKSKIYTKTGDGGSTSLVGGKRVSKTHSRIEAYGTVDELNSFIACLLEEIETDEEKKILLRIQHQLFSLGAYLATESGQKAVSISPEEVEILERAIDTLDESLPPMKFFVLPGGCKANAWAHVCRTIARRAERCIYRIAEDEVIEPVVLQYVNRLSDYFFLLARKQNISRDIKEIKWEYCK